MINPIRHRITPRQIIIYAAAALVLLVVARIVTQSVWASPSVSRSGQHVLKVYDDGTERGILTDASTLREALDAADVKLNENDITEPSLDSELVAATYDVNIYRSRPVMVVDGSTVTKVMTPYHTAKQIAKQADIDLRSEDRAQLEHSSDLVLEGALERLVIDRAQEINLVFYGQKTTLYSHAKTVAELLEEREISLESNDRLSVKAGTPLKAGMKVEIWRDGKQTITEEEAIKRPVQQIQDTDREAGYREVKTPGKDGKRSVTYEIVMKNGQEISRTEISSVVVVKPVKEVVVVGAKPAFGGDLAASFAALRQCESGGNYANKNNPLYRGAYQFGYGTWANYGGFYDPADAPPAIQDKAALELYQRRGWQPWPACSAKLGLR